MRPKVNARSGNLFLLRHGSWLAQRTRLRSWDFPSRSVRRPLGFRVCCERFIECRELHLRHHLADRGRGFGHQLLIEIEPPLGAIGVAIKRGQSHLGQRGQSLLRLEATSSKLCARRGLVAQFDRGRSLQIAGDVGRVRMRVVIDHACNCVFAAGAILCRGEQSGPGFSVFPPDESAFASVRTAWLSSKLALSSCWPR